MRTESKVPADARQQTDHSLHAERKKTDVEIEKRESAANDRSDSVVERARGRADVLLKEARSHADETLAREHPSTTQREAIATDRAVEDSVVHGERAAADEQLENERDERLVALHALLKFEREETDERLLIERARGDASVAARDNFMTMVGHDIRNLLGSIALAAASQARKPGTDEVGQRNLHLAEKIQRLTARINRLIGDLFDVNSIESGRFSVAPARHDARALVDEAHEVFGSLAAAKGITIEPVDAAGPLEASFDRDRIFQVLANLLSNAVKFTGEGGRISLSVEATPAELHFSVSDDGPGIAADQLELVFDRFWQVRKDDRRGMGLGLFISKCIVETHHGRMWAESELGKGSTFHFTLPMA